MGNPLAYEIDPRAGRVHVTYGTQPTFDQWAATMERIIGDPQYETGFGFLLDRSRVTRPASTDYIHRMVNFIESCADRNGDARWALLVVDLGSFGMARMAELLSLSGKIRAFFIMEEAKTWLATGG